MSERVQVYFEMLKGSSSIDLDCSAKKLVLSEKQNVARLIAHISEIGDRKYHLKLGYKNLFDYCVKRLHLGEGSVYRRTQVSRICRRHPQILESLHAGHLNLTGASLIAPHLTADNAETLISEAGGKTKQEIKELIVKFAPKEPFKPSFRKNPSKSPKPEEAKMSEEDTKTLKLEGLSANDPAVRAENHKVFPSNGQRTRDIFEPATEDTFNIRFNAGKEFEENFNRLCEVLGVENARTNIEKVLGQAIKIALDKKDPKRRLEQRRKREEKKKTACSGKSCPGDGEEKEKQEKKKLEAHKTKQTSESTTAIRYVSQKVKERVFEKAGHQCEYQSPEGVRCSSRTGLQIDHILPFAICNSNDEENLQILCPAHNQFAAEEFYGSKYIEQKIKERRLEKVKRYGVE